jgi:hypothetical protein
VTAIYGLYADADSALRAVDGLRAAGLPDRDITVVSAEPIEHHPLGERDRATWMFWIASGGGAIGLAVAAWLTRMTELAWPLPTGNMPIVAWWPNLIVMFELTMLGAILATVVTLFITAELPRQAAPTYDAAVADGAVLVGVEYPPDALVPKIERALEVRGGTVTRVA